MIPVTGRYGRGASPGATSACMWTASPKRVAGRRRHRQDRLRRLPQPMRSMRKQPREPWELLLYLALRHASAEPPELNVVAGAGVRRRRIFACLQCMHALRLVDACDASSQHLLLGYVMQLE